MLPRVESSRVHDVINCRRLKHSHQLVKSERSCAWRGRLYQGVLVVVHNACTFGFQGQQKLVCGSGDGVLYLFNWGEWGNMSDRFPGHAGSISCVIALNDDIVCTGSSDGKIR